MPSHQNDLSQAIEDFDHHDPALGRDSVHHVYERMRAQCPVAHTRAYGGFWVVTRYEDVRTAIQNYRVFSSASGVMLPPPGNPPIIPLELDPPEHALYRGLMWSMFSPEKVAAADPMIRENTLWLLDALAASDNPDLLHEFAEPLPLAVVLDHIGLTPEEKGEVRALAADAFTTTGSMEAAARAMQSLTETFGAALAARRRNPRGDYISVLAGDEAASLIDGASVRPLSQDEAVGILMAMVVGGHHTTVRGLAAFIMRISASPDLRRELIDSPDLVAPALEEVLRLEPPVHHFRRRVTTPVNLGGQELNEGDDVLLVYASANRDEEVFENPDSFDLHRKHNRHLAFGLGIHRCLGMDLARAELRIAITELLRAYPHFRLLEEPVWHDYRTVSRLPAAL